MSLSNPKVFRLSERDLDFLVETASPEVADKLRLKMILKEDADFRHKFVGDERVFRRVMGDDDVFLKISPTLFFETLLRKAATDLEKMNYTLETAGTMRIPVFDAKDVVGLLTKEALLVYLADMLSSFTRVESYAISFRERKGVWHKIRFNDMDMQSLMSFCDVVEGEHRLGLYKRIADLCLFILGLFPDYVAREHRYPFSGHLRPQMPGKRRMNPEDYVEEGRKFYRLAAEHPSAKEMDLSEVFRALHGNFQQAKKPLNFIAEHYLHSKRHQLFGY
jgi:hypothetical protein